MRKTLLLTPAFLFLACGVVTTPLPPPTIEEALYYCSQTTLTPGEIDALHDGVILWYVNGATYSTAQAAAEELCMRIADQGGSPGVVMDCLSCDYTLVRAVYEQ